jgi:DNA-binding response OmpR family regulator
MPVNRILLIEDEATTRELLTHALRGEGYAVDAAETAAAAATHLESGPYALVIADWLLPDGNGIDLADRATKLGAKTIVFSEHLFRLPAGSADPHQLMMKPVRPGEIVAAVRRVIGRPRAEV